MQPACTSPNPPAVRLLHWRDALVSALVVGAIAVCAVALPAHAHAVEPIVVRDGDTTVLPVSLVDQTRLRVDGGRILDVIGDVYDADKNPSGRVVVLKDEPAGEVYVKPMTFIDGTGRSAQPQTVKLDVKTDRGTVGLLLQPMGVPGDTKTLRIVGGQRASARGPLDKGPAHLRAVKALTLAMAAPELGAEVSPQDLPNGGKEVALWQEARFVLKQRYQVPGLVGEAYELTNTSAQRMVLDEREFYRDGVVSVGLKSLSLQPGESTPVWIIRTANGE